MSEANAGVGVDGKDPDLQKWINRHPGYLYDVTPDGYHLVKTRRNQVVAYTTDPADALETARSWE